MENGRVFALRITSEKNLKNRKNLFIALMNREETYYRVKCYVEGSVGVRL